LPQARELGCKTFCSRKKTGRSVTRCAAFKCPKKILFLDELPTNPSGKVLKRELVAAYIAAES
jgi:acyl-CoA synthetase (AMP-forming)/AMP-acid ligase II